MPDALHCIASLVEISNKFDHISVGYIQNTARSTLKLYSRTTNSQTYMKLGPYLYHLNTFNIPNNEGVNEWVGGGATKKNTRKCHEIKRISTLT